MIWNILQSPSNDRLLALGMLLPFSSTDVTQLQTDFKYNLSKLGRTKIQWLKRMLAVRCYAL
jgi:hypothetical protein